MVQMMSDDEPAREKMENELLRSTAALRSLPDSVVICDRAGIVRFINPAGARLLQIDADACIRQSIGKLPGGIVLPSELGEQEYEQLIEIEYEDQRCNIIPIWSEVRAKSHIGFLITIKPVHLEMLSLQELRTLIGYELRGSLTSIRGCAELILRGLAGELSEQQRELMQIVDDASRRLFGVVDNIFTVARLDSSRMRLFIDEVNVYEIVNEVIASKKKLIDERSIACDLEVSSEISHVRIDRDKLREIVSQLFDNACRYTPTGGNVRVNLRIESDQLRCDIQDTGIGISQGAQPLTLTHGLNDYGNPLRDKIDHYSGSGLGLIITKRLIDLHGGRIWFASTVGGGSTFSFTLPISEVV
jgi:signal transduction histidine kinase